MVDIPYNAAKPNKTKPTGCLFSNSADKKSDSDSKSRI